MKKPRVLVVDDQYASDAAEQALFLKRTCGKRGTSEPSRGASGAAIADMVFCSAQQPVLNRVVTNDYSVVADAINAGNRRSWALVLLDMRFDSGKVGLDGVPVGQPGDDKFGEKVRRELLKTFPELPVVIMTSKKHIDLVNREVAYLSKDDLDAESLTSCLLRHGRLSTDQIRTLLQLGDNEIAAATETLTAFCRARESARGSHSVLLLGETGTGKEVLAKYIHLQSGRDNFVGLNIAAIPSNLFESEMFGAVKGAFTDLKVDRPGFLERANLGTLFLDEIADMDGDAQAKILRAIEERKANRIGSRTFYSFDVRLISATARNIDERLATGLFREDLYYRVSGDVIVVPPLRKRREDIGPLATAFLDEASLSRGKRGLILTPDALRRLGAYDFPGNVRELRHLMTRLATRAGRNQAISARDVELVLPQASASTLRPETGQKRPLASAKQVQRDGAETFGRGGLSGALTETTEAYAATAVRLIERALNETRHIGRRRSPLLGDLNPTAAMKLILGRPDMTTAQAADEIKRIGAIVEAPDPDSAFAQALAWARGLRRTETKSADGAT